MRKSIGVGLMTAFFLTACDLSVENVGPVADGSLDSRDAHNALVAGARLTLSLAINMASYFGADAAKEYTQGGRIHPTKLPVQPGQLTVDGIPNNAWNTAQQARWVAEDAIRRMKNVVGTEFTSYKPGAQALLYAGYANRLLGENMCEAVIDGSAPQPIARFFEAAEAHFTEAFDVAGAAGDAATATAARAGRASARLYLGKNAEALADAAAVPVGFQFQAVFSIESENNYNFIYWVNANQPYRAHSVVNTFYDQYYTDTGDPRVSWARNPAVPNAEFTHVPWYYQTKYTRREAPVNLSTGREMRLIEAEIALRNNNLSVAMQLINSLRTSVISTKTNQPLLPWTATTLAEGWTHLKRERGIELWLEARRLGDLRRWVDAQTPGAMENVSDRVRLCLPIANSERQTNANVGLTHVDPVNPLYTGN